MNDDDPFSKEPPPPPRRVRQGPLEPPDTPQSQAPDDGNQEQILGMPKSSFKKDEREYIDEQMKRFLDLCASNPGARVYVDQIILTGIEMRRHDAKVAKERMACGVRPSEDKIRWFIQMDKIKDGLLERHTRALEAIGFLPKDIAARQEHDRSLSDVHLAYVEEIKRMKEAGLVVGQPSPAAKALLAQVGLKPDTFQRADVLPDAVRDEVVAKISESRGQ